jgi:hypothetical protein
MHVFISNTGNSCYFSVRIFQQFPMEEELFVGHSQFFTSQCTSSVQEWVPLHAILLFNVDPFCKKPVIDILHVSENIQHYLSS